ncbi:MAG: FecR domain-containing protein [Prolixibacteraceae bacterium]|nr:FecR domain-containing protein [Prolixibacteraceae bacterium]
MKDSDSIFEVYAKVLSKECTQDEIKDLFDRLELDLEEKARFEKLQKLWNSNSSELYSSEQIWQLTSDKLGFGKKITSQKLKFRPWLRYVAAAIFVFSIALNSYFLIDRQTNRTNDIIEYSAKNGEIKKIELPDGSSVWLNSESTLILQEQFDGKSRDVFLIGEAYFKVSKNPEKPFLVNTSEVVVKVLGTSFSVRNYKNDPDVSTSLVEGSVQLLNKDNPSNSVILKPSEEALFSKSNGELTVRKQQNSLIAPWREGRVRFHDHDLLTITNQLERKFDCEFVFLDVAAESLRFTGDFENESIDEILLLLNKAHTFKYKKSGHRYIISL